MISKLIVILITFGIFLLMSYLFAALYYALYHPKFIRDIWNNYPKQLAKFLKIWWISGIVFLSVSIILHLIKILIKTLT